MMNVDFNSSGRKRVLLRAPVLTQSGYGVHARQIARWLLEKTNIELHIQPLQWGVTPWMLNPDSQRGLIRSIMEKTVEPRRGEYDVSIQLQLPNEWDPGMAKVNVGVTAGVETDRCNPQWIQHCNAMTHVVVPSKHVVDTFRSTGNLTVPVSIIPEAYHDELAESSPTKVDEMTFSTSFNFLIVGQLTGNNPENDRKNVFYAIKWFCETFKDNADVGLIIKTNLGRNTALDRTNVFQLLKKLLSEVRSGLLPRVHLLHGDMSDSEMASLYRHRQVKALLAPTRGEGYGLPILEAAACGLPVITTGWSGHMDFMGKGKFIKLDHTMVDVHESRVDGSIFVKGARWAQPSEADFKARLQKFHKGPEVPRQWAAELKEKVLTDYSQVAIQKIYDEKLVEYL